jgi:PAS domain-containing protein
MIALFVAIFFCKTFLKFSLIKDYPRCSFLKDITLILFTGIQYRYILFKDQNQDKKVLENFRAQPTLYKNQIKYDTVTKATSETIWDWKIQEDKIFWNNEILAVFGYNKHQVGDSSKCWFDNIPPEDSINIFIKLLSFIEQKTDNWQNEYQFKCSNHSYK